MDKKRIVQGEQFIFNGIDGATGAYLTSPLSPQQISAIAMGDAQDKEHLYDLRLRYQRATTTKRRVKAGINPLELSSAGWGIIFAKNDSDKLPAIREALGDLLELRRVQAGERYKEFSAEAGYQEGENYLNFLARKHIGPGPADPEKVPYYLLIAGDPESIPFEFQYQLDVQYAVGRIYFDTLEQYANYARSVVEMETRENTSPRRAVLFGVQNQDDPATQLSANHLVQPLADHLSGQQGVGDWEIRSVIGEGATKSTLSELMGGKDTPTMFFSASHGMGFPINDPRQIPHQGALLCQDWPGPHAWKEAIPEDYYFSASDISSDSQLTGSIAFHFACYGAGTPKMDDFSHQAFLEPKAIAPRSFVAQLPQKLLSHPKGGMLAVIGHVERAWGYSFAWQNTGSQLAVFESALLKIMEGSPVGYAMEYFNERYAELSTILSTELQGVQFGKIVDDVELAGMWTANNDARSYVILGDPAVHIPEFAREQLTIQEEHVSQVTLSEKEIKMKTVAGEQAQQFTLPQEKEVEGSAPEIDLELAGAEPVQLTLLTAEKLDQLLNEGTSLQWAKFNYLVGSSISQMVPGSWVESLKISISQFQSALREINQDEHAVQWRQIQFRLAYAFAELYSLTGEDRYAVLAARINSAVLESIEQDEDPDAWVQANLKRAHLYARMYEKSSDIAIAQQALEAYQKVLAAIDRQIDPVTWAQIHQNLAKLQVDLYDAGGDERYRTGAVDNFHAALEVFNVELFPYQYVTAKINIGDLSLAGKDGNQEDSIELAIEAYKSAQEVASRVADVISEARMQMKLGDAYLARLKGDRTKNVFTAGAYYKHSLNLLREINDQEGIEEINLKIQQLKSIQSK
jgi:hypothetical protein